jgi:cytoskeletal protein RodZ
MPRRNAAERVPALDTAALPPHRQKQRRSRGWLARSMGRVSDVVVFAWWVASGMPEEEQMEQTSVAGRRGKKQHIPTILARQQERDPDIDRTEQAAATYRTPPKSPKSPKHKSPTYSYQSISPKTFSPLLHTIAMSPKNLNQDGEMSFETELQVRL